MIFRVVKILTSAKRFLRCSVIVFSYLRCYFYTFETIATRFFMLDKKIIRRKKKNKMIIACSKQPTLNKKKKSKEMNEIQKNSSSSNFYLKFSLVLRFKFKLHDFYFPLNLLRYDLKLDFGYFQSIENVTLC